LRLRNLGINRFSTVACVAVLAATLSSAQDAQPAAAPPHTSTSAAAKPKSTTTHSTASKSKSKKSKKSSKATAKHTHGQQKIDSQRTLQIQEALIREHYLDGKPTGVWNQETEQAMQRYQADNNWQSKTTPDARALIKLGLGPDHEHLLNPESAMTSQPQSATPAATDKQQR
jgi:Putative peptidoglycan binding domain